MPKKIINTVGLDSDDDGIPDSSTTLPTQENKTVNNSIKRQEQLEEDDDDDDGIPVQSTTRSHKHSKVTINEPIKRQDREEDYEEEDDDGIVEKSTSPNLLRMESTYLNSSDDDDGITVDDTTQNVADLTHSKSEFNRYEHFIDIVEELCVFFKDLTQSDAVLKSHFKMIEECLTYIRVQSQDDQDASKKPIFLFNDGPVAKAVKYGSLLILEDFDLPSQAVTERLNSLFENEPYFQLNEDINLSMNMNHSIHIPSSFNVVAIVHQESEYQMLNLSPAALSRFTQIRVEPYEENDIESIVNNQIFHLTESDHNRNNAQHFKKEQLASLIISLRKIIIAKCDLKNDIQQLFRWLDFIFKVKINLPDTVLNLPTDGKVDVVCLGYVLLGARFFYLLDVNESTQLKIVDEWLNKLNLDRPTLTEPIKKYFYELIKLPEAKHGALNPTQGHSFSSLMDMCPFSVISDTELQLKYTGLVFKTNKNYADEQSKLTSALVCIPTPSLIKQFSYLIATVSTGCPLLLQGPPGVGKTAVVNQICELTGVECERINCSTNTTLDHFFGSFIPQSENGKRVFKFKEGKIISAIRNNKWILLDEINLAPPEVLDGLVPLLVCWKSKNKEFLNVRDNNTPYKVDNLRIFATMNPSNIGGGRSKLPLSIRNLFSILTIEKHTEVELRLIMTSLFTDLVTEQFMTEKQVDNLFYLYLKLKHMLDKGTIGRVGGPYDINLRDFTKLHDIIKNNFKDQVSHHEDSFGDDDSGPNTITDEKRQQIAVIILRYFIELIFVKQFQAKSDQEQVEKLIDEYFPRSNIVINENSDFSSLKIDSGVENVLRVGSVYMQKQSSADAYVPLIHSNNTCEQLETLAAAVESKRAVLIEGETCSRKTALVKELARLSGNKLLVMSMHQDIEVSHLIGQWLPVSLNQAFLINSARVKTELNRLLNSFLLYGLMCLQEKKELNNFLNYLYTAWSAFSKNQIGPTLANLETVCSSLKRNLDDSPHKKMLVLIEIEHVNLKRVKDLVDEDSSLLTLQESAAERQSSSGVIFQFVESEFVQAIREGWWILLDNVNNTPPEVVERLNSLIEEKPFLGLYEGENAKVLTIENGGINKQFRLFATADIQRPNTNRLSSAFLNRVIRIWLPALDEDLLFSASNALFIEHSLNATVRNNDEDDDKAAKFNRELREFIRNPIEQVKDNQVLKFIETQMKKSDIFDIASSFFNGIYGGDGLCLILIKFHSLMKHLVESGQVFMSQSGAAQNGNESYKLTIRKIIQTIQTFTNSFVIEKSEAADEIESSMMSSNFLDEASDLMKTKGQINQLEALLIAIVRNYVYSMGAKEDRKKACQILAAIVLDTLGPNCNNFEEFAKLLKRNFVYDTPQAKFKQEISETRLHETLQSVETTLLQFVCTLFYKLTQPSSSSNSKSLIIAEFSSFLSNYLIPYNQKHYKKNSGSTVRAKHLTTRINEHLKKIEDDLKESRISQDANRAMDAINRFYNRQSEKALESMFELTIGLDKKLLADILEINEESRRASLDALKKKVKSNMNKLDDSFESLTRESALNDISDRPVLLKAILANMHRYESLLRNLDSLKLFETLAVGSLVESKALQSMLSTVEIIFKFEIRLQWFVPFESKLLKDMKNQIDIDLEQEKGLLFRLHVATDNKRLINLTNLNGPIKKLIARIKNQSSPNRNKSLVPTMRKYFLLVDCLRESWCLNFKIPPEVMFVPGMKRILSGIQLTDKIHSIEAFIQMSKLNKQLVTFLDQLHRHLENETAKLKECDKKLANIRSQKEICLKRATSLNNQITLVQNSRTDLLTSQQKTEREAELQSLNEQNLANNQTIAKLNAELEKLNETRENLHNMLTEYVCNDTNNRFRNNLLESRLFTSLQSYLNGYHSRMFVDFMARLDKCLEKFTASDPSEDDRKWPTRLLNSLDVSDVETLVNIQENCSEYILLLVAVLHIKAEMSKSKNSIHSGEKHSQHQDEMAIQIVNLNSQDNYSTFLSKSSLVQTFILMEQNGEIGLLIASKNQPPKSKKVPDEIVVNLDFFNDDVNDNNVNESNSEFHQWKQSILEQMEQNGRREIVLNKVRFRLLTRILNFQTQLFK